MDMESRWIWTDGCESPYTNWDSKRGQPDGGSAENCAKIESTGSGLWHDFPCKKKLAFVCQRQNLEASDEKEEDGFSFDQKGAQQEDQTKKVAAKDKIV